MVLKGPAQRKDVLSGREMAKGKQTKPSTTTATPDAATSPPENATEVDVAPPPASPYDRPPEGGGKGALVFLGVIALLLGGAIVVGLLQGQ